MRKRMMYLLLVISVLSQCFTGVSFAKAKTKYPVEEIWFTDGDHYSVTRRKYGLIAKNVDEVSVNSDLNFGKFIYGKIISLKRFTYGRKKESSIRWGPWR